MNLAALRRAAIDHVAGIEGGYVNDPSDSGGETRFGITEAVARAAGYRGPMRELPPDVARAIYEREYWHEMRLDGVAHECPLLAAELLDSGVNCGTGTAAKWLQLALNASNDRGRLYPDVAEDGAIGDETLGALRALRRSTPRDTDRLLATMCNALQGAHYVALSRRREKDERYVKGWFRHRVMASADLIARVG